MIRHIALTLGLGLLPAATLAQGAPDPAATWQAANNQLGILQYCEAQGHSGPEAVETQARMVEMLPSGDEATATEAVELGAQGTVAVGTEQLSLEDAATNQGSTVEATCQQIEAAVNAIEPSLPAG